MGEAPQCGMRTPGVGSKGNGLTVQGEKDGGRSWGPSPLPVRSELIGDLVHQFPIILLPSDFLQAVKSDLVERASLLLRQGTTLPGLSVSLGRDRVSPNEWESSCDLWSPKRFYALGGGWGHDRGSQTASPFLQPHAYTHISKDPELLNFLLGSHIRTKD